MQPEINTNPSAWQRLGYLVARAGRFLGDWREILFFVPALLVACVAGLFLLPAISRQAGMPIALDGLAELYTALVVVIKLTLAGFGAWLFKRLYMYDLSDAEERRLQEQLSSGYDHTWRVALIRLAADRIEWFACFLICCWALF